MPQQNLITPVGTEKIGGFEYAINLNDAVPIVKKMGDLPIKAVNGAMVYVRDVAQVRDGNPPQQNIVHVDGNRSVLMFVLKNGAVSTLSIIDGVKQKLQEMKRTLPANLTLTAIGDQSIFIKAAIGGVIREGIIAAALTSVMILLFLGSFRSTLIIATSIPLSVLGSIATLWALGETLNIMTLGGLALAVGILVDEATVTIENINWHLEKSTKARTTGDIGRRTTNCGSRLCLAAVHLHRLCTDVFPARHFPSFLVRPDGGAIDVDNDRLLHPFSHPGSDDGQLSACCPWRCKRRLGGAPARCLRWASSSNHFFSGFSMVLRYSFEKVRNLLYHPPFNLAMGEAGGFCRRLFFPWLFLVLGSGAIFGQEFLSGCGCRRDEPACAGTPGSARALRKQRR